MLDANVTESVNRKRGRKSNKEKEMEEKKMLDSTTMECVTKKRGRKSSKEREEMEKKKMLDSTAVESVRKKRGRKSNKEKEEMEKKKISDSTAMENVSKKRGRKSNKEREEMENEKKKMLDASSVEEGVSEQRECSHRGSKQEMITKVSRKKPKCDEEGRLTCHQCKRNDKGRVVRCSSCERRRFCLMCLRAWYPHLKEDDVVEKCPVCHGYCNCKACLSSDELIKKMRESAETDADENVELSMYMLRVLLPYLRQLDKEQMIENEIEANIQGIFSFRSLGCAYSCVNQCCYVKR